MTVPAVLVYVTKFNFICKENPKTEAVRQDHNKKI